MLKSFLGRRRELFGAILIATVLTASTIAESGVAWAAGVCRLLRNEGDPSVRILKCGQELTVRAAPGTRYRPIYNKQQQLPAAIRLDDGALLIEFHAENSKKTFRF